MLGTIRRNQRAVNVVFCEPPERVPPTVMSLLATPPEMVPPLITLYVPAVIFGEDTNSLGEDTLLRLGADMITSPEASVMVMRVPVEIEHEGDAYFWDEDEGVELPPPLMPRRVPPVMMNVFWSQSKLSSG